MIEDKEGLTFLIRVKANHDCWIANHGHGDPARTLVRSSARVFETYVMALKLLVALEERYPNRSFKVEINE